MAKAKVKTRKCRLCHVDFIQYNSLVPVCIDCAPKYALSKLEKKRKADNKAFKDNSLNSDRSHLTKKAQESCNRYIRERDKDKPCVSCGTTNEIQYHAGHFMSVGARHDLRFNEYNIHKQCVRCNNYLSGNAAEYRKELINRIGLRHVEWLEWQGKAQKLSCADLIEIREYYKEKLNALNRND